MDTDDLSDETYQGIIIEAEIFLHDLTLHFGILASDCKNEDEYLIKASKMIKVLKKAKKNDYYDLFFGATPTVSAVFNTLQKIEQNIIVINKTPLEERTFKRWGPPKHVKALIKANTKGKLHRS